MKRVIPALFLIILIASCKKTESDFIWENSYGKGEALFLTILPDSGFIACGSTDNKPYLIHLSKEKSRVMDFHTDQNGLFSSALKGTFGYITCGNSSGKMLLMRHSDKGDMVWDEVMDAGFRIDNVMLLSRSPNSIIAIGSAHPDSLTSGKTGLYIVSFDTIGNIISRNKIEENSSVAAGGAELDIDGNLCLALTRREGGIKTKASVAKYNNSLQKLWETDLFNNPGFGSASLAIESDGSGNIFVSGKTELPTGDGTLNNSFVVSLNNSGNIRTDWKKYIESSNAGNALLFDDSGSLMMLNRNCCVINIISSDGTDEGRIQTFTGCDSYNSDALGSDFGINFDKNILVAGSYGGNFFLALKSVQ